MLLKSYYFTVLKNIIIYIMIMKDLKKVRQMKKSNKILLI